MRKSLITTAVLGALAVSSFAFAAEETKSDFTTSGSVGLFSQYIFRGLTQTDRDPALQGNFDINHSSGLYLGMWGSNVSWLRDKYGTGTPAEEATYYKSGGNLEIDIYGGFKSEIGKTGLGIDLGALQYYYPGTERGRDQGWAKANTTEVYGALSYGWLQAKYSHVVSKDAWGWGKYSGQDKDAKGTYYAELNATVPIGELIGGGPLKGLSGIAHYGKQEFDNDTALGMPSYEDYKLGLSNAFDNGVNIGAFWTDTKDASDTAWVYNGRNIGKQTGTVFLQKTF
ncbi:MAG: hypothetical protein EBR39_03520 [Betaproteobacteria bacterium]|nr:hypothetical protein [Betaproteobacteria bacterium]